MFGGLTDGLSGIGASAGAGGGGRRGGSGGRVRGGKSAMPGLCARPRARGKKRAGAQAGGPCIGQ